MKGKFKLLGHIGLMLFLVSALVLTLAPVAQAATAVTSVWMEFPTEALNNVATPAQMAIHFTPTTAMSMGVDTITVWFPDGADSTMGPVTTQDDYDFELGSASTTAANYTVKGTGTTYYACIAAATVSGYRLKVTTPVDIPAGTAAALKIAVGANIVTPDEDSNTYKVKVATSQDTTFVLSSAFSVDDTPVSTFVNASTMPSSSVAGGGSAYGFTFDPAGEVSTAGWITVEFPVGTYLPDSISTDYVKAGAVWATKDDDPPANGVEVDTAARTIKVNPSEATGTAATAYVYFMASAGIKNPEVITDTATRDMFIWTSVDAQKVKGTSLISLVAGSPSKLSFADSTTSLTESDDATILHAFTGILYLEVQDQYGNFVAPVSDPTVTFATSGSGIVATTASTATATTSNATTGGKLSLYYRNTVAEVDTITASVAAGGYDPATWDVTVAPSVVLTDASGNTIGTYGPTVTDTTDSSLGGAAIQAAINAAFTGDTVTLGDGTYEVGANIALNKEITLTSTNGASSTTLDSAELANGGTVMTISADEATVDGLKFLDPAGSAGFTTPFNEYYAFDVCNVTRSLVAIQPAASDVTIQNCIFEGYDENIPESAVNWTIHGNDFSNGTYGLRAQGSTSLEVSDNTFTRIGSGIFAYEDDMSITDNIFTDCGKAVKVDANGGTLDGVTITGNTITGSWFEAGIIIDDLTGAITNLTISENTITGSKLDGILISETDLQDATGTNVIKYNDIYGNGRYGINTAQTTDATEPVNCQYNYWGSPTGPLATANPSGTGDAVNVTVADTITYSPWLYKSKADVVADNANYCAQRVDLAVGISTLSTPALLITTADTIAELMPDYATNMEYCYKYENGIWSTIGGDTLTPCSAYYIKMTVADSVVLQYAADEYYTPSKALTAGWNLMGLANLSSKIVESSVTSVSLTAAGLPGYSQVISPSMNTSPWSYSAGETAASTYMLVGEGYWIYMQNAATLAGFTIFPLVPDLD